jgi:hypothetical protein
VSVDHQRGRPVLELRMVRGIHWDLRMRREGPSREPSTIVTIEGKQGSAVATHRSGQWDDDEGRPDVRRGIFYSHIVQSKMGMCGVCQREA